MKNIKMLLSRLTRVEQDSTKLNERFINLDDRFLEGLRYYENQDYRKCKQILEHLADLGHPKSQYYLGLMNERGHGMKRSARRAFKWFLKAANNDYGPAQSALFDIYKDGKGVKSNTKEAIRWCSSAADKMLDDAMHNMGINYMEGYGVQKNMHEALQWYLKSAHKNNMLSQYSVAYMYLKGGEINKNYEEAYFWLLIALENSPCHFSNSDSFLNECFNETCSEYDKDMYRQIQQAIRVIPERVRNNSSIRDKAIQWLSQQSNNENTSSSNFLKKLVRDTLEN